MSTLSSALAGLLAYERQGFQLRRAWPGAEGQLTFEALDGRGQLRAGLVSARGQVKLLEAGQDPKLPQLAENLAEPGSQLLVHRAGKRAVVRQADLVTKHLRPSKVQPLASAHRFLSAQLEVAGLASAQILETGQGSISFSLLPGSTPFDLAKEGQESKALDAWEAFLNYWPQLISRPLKQQAEGAGWPQHGPAQEAQVLASWLGHCRLFGSLDASISGQDRCQQQLELLGAGIMRQLLDGVPSPSRLLHRDLHDKQLLWDGQQLALLDLDTAALGEAELDLGNLLAHLELRQAQGLASERLTGQASSLLEGLAQQLGLAPERLEVYRQAARLRIACLYSFRPGEYHWLGSWIAGLTA